jgi:hypothetical protein
MNRQEEGLVMWNWKKGSENWSNVGMVGRVEANAKCRMQNAKWKKGECTSSVPGAPFPFCILHSAFCIQLLNPE